MTPSLKHDIEKLKNLEKVYNVSMDWHYKENISEEEFIANIGEYEIYKPEEILEVIFE
jgi:hypothetical protein